MHRCFALEVLASFSPKNMDVQPSVYTLTLNRRLLKRTSVSCEPPKARPCLLTVQSPIEPVTNTSPWSPSVQLYMGSSLNFRIPFLGSQYSAAPLVKRTLKGTLLLGTTYIRTHPKTLVSLLRLVWYVVGRRVRGPRLWKDWAQAQREHDSSKPGKHQQPQATASTPPTLFHSPTVPKP